MSIWYKNPESCKSISWNAVGIKFPIIHTSSIHLFASSWLNKSPHIYLASFKLINYITASPEMSIIFANLLSNNWYTRNWFSNVIQAHHFGLPEQTVKLTHFVYCSSFSSLLPLLLLSSEIVSKRISRLPYFIFVCISAHP